MIPNMSRNVEEKDAAENSTEDPFSFLVYMEESLKETEHTVMRCVKKLHFTAHYHIIYVTVKSRKRRFN